MSKKVETIFAEKVDKALRKAYGTDIWIENIQQVGKIGTPDRLVCLNGHFVALEYKTDSGVIAKLQLRKLQKIAHAGGNAFIVSPANLSTVLDELTRIFES